MFLCIQKFSFGTEKIKPGETTVELLMFANKYLMKPLESQCKADLTFKLDKDNLMDFIKAAYDIEDENMIKIGAKNFSKFKNFSHIFKKTWINFRNKRKLLLS